jgi:hypothetical protein
MTQTLIRVDGVLKMCPDRSDPFELEEAFLLPEDYGHGKRICTVQQKNFSIACVYFKHFGRGKFSKICVY